MTEHIEPTQGTFEPDRIYADLDRDLAAADELRTRTYGMADKPLHRRVAGRFLVGIVTTAYEIADLDHPFFASVFRGMRGRLAAGSCDLLLCGNRPAAISDPLWVAAFERTITRGADALVVWGMERTDPAIEEILNAGIPTMFIDTDPIGKRAGCASSDNIAAMIEVVSHLHETGRRRMAHIAGLPNTRPASDRLFGFRSELTQLGLLTPPAYVEQGDYYHHSGFEASKRLLALPEPPDAITCASDTMAIGAMLAIKQAGLRVPEDIAVTGFDDAPFASTCRPTLTTVRQDAQGLGTATAEAVLRMLENPEEPPPTLMLPTELIVRESSGPPAAKS